jgi:hypothetical protein
VEGKAADFRFRHSGNNSMGGDEKKRRFLEVRQYIGLYSMRPDVLLQ